MAGVIPAERWLRLRPLLDQALDLEPAERSGMLDQLGRQAPTLKADLQRLLQLHDTPQPELDQPAAALVGATLALDAQVPQEFDHGPFTGTVVGAFRLERLLGSGGMGAVYLGRRIAGGFDQTVAIKLITGLNPALKKRFARERQILADLRHPHIAQLLDGGESALGLPYLVMEYVEGLTLADHCEQRKAGLDERLRLLIDVAEALAYAHQRKLIHRDIKPGNILVGTHGEVKLLDFGIAKLLDDDAELSALTHQSVGPMTPAYAAPEQFSGETLSAATDIYQFGVLAFRILSGRGPYRQDSGNAAVLARIVSEGNPLSLQAVLKQAVQLIDHAASNVPARGLGPPADLLAHGRTCTDLNLVLRRCLRKEPEERYPSMHAVITELQAIRSRGAPRERGRHGQRWMRAGLWALSVLAACAVALLVWQRWPGSASDDWRNDSALGAMGLDRTLLHVSKPDTETQIALALRREAEGDLSASRALLESIHAADPSTPVPAMLLAYWSASSETEARWRSAAEARIALHGDATLELLWKYLLADAAGDFEGTLRYSGALLELRPNAWYLHMARAHHMARRDMLGAGLKELQQIDVSRLGHRRLSDAIADRASFGDLAGARELVARMEFKPDDPDHALLLARLAFTGGDLEAAITHFRETVRLAKLQARFDLVGRGQFLLGVMLGTRHEFAEAAEFIRNARVVFTQRGQYARQVDASLALAQIAELSGDTAERDAAIAQARIDTERGTPGQIDPQTELFAARLQGQVPTVPPTLETPQRELLQAWQQVLAGDADAARTLLETARRGGIESDAMAEEYRLLCRKLGVELPPLPSLDPLFQPYARFASRWAMGEFQSVMPKPQP